MIITGEKGLNQLRINGIPTCECGKKYSFICESDAQQYMDERKDMPFVRPHRCSIISNRWHLTTTQNSGYDKLKRLEKELHEEMANNPKTIRQRITDYMWDSYQRNKTIKFSSSMVIFALQQDKPETKKPQIAQELSKAKKDGIIVSLKEPVPDQRGAVYFTLARILEEETEPNVTVPKVELPAQSEKPKVIPTNPFDKVHEKLDILIKELVTGRLDRFIREEFKPTLNGVELALQNLSDSQEQQFNSLSTDTRQIKEIASTHVTVDGDKLADVINARLQNLKLEDSFIYRVREETDTLLDRQGQTLLKYLNTIKPPTGVSNSDDYRAGIKDGIRMALEMGLKLDE